MIEDLIVFVIGVVVGYLWGKRIIEYLNLNIRKPDDSQDKTEGLS